MSFLLPFLRNIIIFDSFTVLGIRRSLCIFDWYNCVAVRYFWVEFVYSCHGYILFLYLFAYFINECHLDFAMAMSSSDPFHALRFFNRFSYFIYVVRKNSSLIFYWWSYIPLKGFMWSLWSCSLTFLYASSVFLNIWGGGRLRTNTHCIWLSIIWDCKHYIKIYSYAPSTEKFTLYLKLLHRNAAKICLSNRDQKQTECSFFFRNCI